MGCPAPASPKASRDVRKIARSLKAGLFFSPSARRMLWARVGVRRRAVLHCPVLLPLVEQWRLRVRLRRSGLAMLSNVIERQTHRASPAVPTRRGHLYVARRMASMERSLLDDAAASSELRRLSTGGLDQEVGAVTQRDGKHVASWWRRKADRERFSNNLCSSKSRLQHLRCRENA